MLFVSLVTLYKNFSKFFVLSISLVIIFIQILDITIGLKNHKFKDKLIIYKNQNDPLWDVIDENFEYLRTTYLFNNYARTADAILLKLTIEFLMLPFVFASSSFSFIKLISMSKKLTLMSKLVSPLIWWS